MPIDFTNWDKLSSPQLIKKIKKQCQSINKKPSNFGILETWSFYAFVINCFKLGLIPKDKADLNEADLERVLSQVEKTKHEKLFFAFAEDLKKLEFIQTDLPLKDENYHKIIFLKTMILSKKNQLPEESHFILTKK